MDLNLSAGILIRIIGLDQDPEPKGSEYKFDVLKPEFS